MLPQQSLMLRVAAEAIADAGWDDRPGLRAGVRRDRARPEHDQLPRPLVAARQGPRWNDRLGLGLADEALDGWVERAARRRRPAAVGQPDDGGARGHRRQPGRPRVPPGRAELHGLERGNLGLRALDVAGRLLRRGEIDEAIVGAVDLPGDLRASLAEATSTRPTSRRRRGGAGPQAARRRDPRRRQGLRRGPRHRRGHRRPTRAGRHGGRPGLRRAGVDPSRHRPGRDDAADPEASAEAAALDVVVGGRSLLLGSAGATSATRGRPRGWPRWSRRRLPCISRSSPARGESAGAGSPFAPRPAILAPRPDRRPAAGGVGGVGVDGNVARVILEG